MCCDYVFGGDFEHPYVSGHNQYKLWTRSSIFEGFYCIVLLFAVAVAILISITSGSLDMCYESSLSWVILAHMIKPFIITIFMKCIPTKPLCCAILRLSPMFFLDVPYAMFVFVFSYFPLLKCILDNEIEIDTLILFILLACLLIHLIFPMMATVRLIEVIVFEKKVKKLREENIHNIQQRDMPAPREQRQHDQPDVQSELSELEVVPINAQIQNQIEEEFEMDENEPKDQFDETFVYGNINEDKTSLSNIFAASTKFISSGMWNKWDEEDICIICYDNFEKGKLCAKLKCGHFFHRECVKDWLAESATCPLCRIGVTKQ